MKNLAGIRDLKDYAKIIDTLFISYVKTDEFITGSDRERADVVDACHELKGELLKAE